MLRDFEYELLRQTTTIQLIRGLAKVLTMKTGEDPNHVQALLQFQKIVSHFYLVSKVYNHYSSTHLKRYNYAFRDPGSQVPGPRL